MTASDVMTPDPECLTREDSIRRAAELMRDLEVGILPVVDDRDTNRLAGVITDRDIAIRCVAEGFQEHHTVGDYMTSGFIARVEPDADIADVLRTMQQRQIRRLPVTDADERLIGIIALADMATEQVDREQFMETVARVAYRPRSRRRPASDGRIAARSESLFQR